MMRGHVLGLKLTTKEGMELLGHVAWQARGPTQFSHRGVDDASNTKVEGGQ